MPQFLLQDDRWQAGAGAAPLVPRLASRSCPHALLDSPHASSPAKLCTNPPSLKFLGLPARVLSLWSLHMRSPMSNLQPHTLEVRFHHNPGCRLGGPSIAAWSPRGLSSCRAWLTAAARKKNTGGKGAETLRGVSFWAAHVPLWEQAKLQKQKLAADSYLEAAGTQLHLTYFHRLSPVGQDTCDYISLEGSFQGIKLPRAETGPGGGSPRSSGEAPMRTGPEGQPKSRTPTTSSWGEAGDARALLGGTSFVLEAKGRRSTGDAEDKEPGTGQAQGGPSLICPLSNVQKQQGQNASTAATAARGAIAGARVSQLHKAEPCQALAVKGSLFLKYCSFNRSFLSPSLCPRTLGVCSTLGDSKSRRGPQVVR